MDTYKHSYTGGVSIGFGAIIVINTVFKVILRSMLGSKVKTWDKTRLGWGFATEVDGGNRWDKMSRFSFCLNHFLLTP